MKKQPKKKTQFLKRSNPVMIRFNDAELREFNSRAKRSGLSRVEFGRRKILNVPLTEEAEIMPERSES
jgi:hypothetical protein